MTTDKFCFYLQNRLIQMSQTGGQWYSDTSPFSIPCLECGRAVIGQRKREIRVHVTLSPFLSLSLPFSLSLSLTGEQEQGTHNLFTGHRERERERERENLLFLSFKNVYETNI
jgi:hypothetical protein